MIFDVDDLINRFKLEERIYRHRCVEAWSMVVPWLGFQMSKLIKHCNPLSSAKYIKFTTFFFIGQIFKIDSVAENSLDTNLLCSNCGHYKQKHCQVQCPFNIIV